MKQSKKDQFVNDTTSQNNWNINYVKEDVYYN